MGILQAENSVSFTANNACKIYIIKQVENNEKTIFERTYLDYINSQKPLSKKFDFNVLDNDEIQLTPLITYDDPKNNILYERMELKPVGDDYPDAPDNNVLWFYKPLIELRNCPLLDFSKLAYVFQIQGQTKSGLSNVVSFNTAFNVNGQSSCELIINNKDFKYNFKYFNDDNKYNLHLKPFFDTNDIIIVRFQKKNTNSGYKNAQIFNSFVKDQINTFDDPYIEAENDKLTTIFTGYINDINSSFSFSNGQQTMSIVCTGPSKKLTWTRILTNNAVGSKDSGSALLPISAFVNPQTNDDNNKVTLSNKDVVKNVIVRTLSGVLSIKKAKEYYTLFQEKFDKNSNNTTDPYKKNLEEKIKNAREAKNVKLEQSIQNEINQYNSSLANEVNTLKELYNETIMSNMNKFVDEDIDNGTLRIKKHTFLPFKCPYVFVIDGTTQPAYQYTFNNFQDVFQSDFSTVYQFIKGIADTLQFNFYDDPYGTIHFCVPDMTLLHLESGKHPNNITQLISFSETQNTENIANVQYAQAKTLYNLDYTMINGVVKDYQSIARYGERMMQVFTVPGLEQQTAIRYAAKMRMYKYNRKALSNIRISMYGEPQIKFDKYAYIKELRKLFYIESYAHSYSAGGEFTTSVNGTYTREILARAENIADLSKIPYENTGDLNRLSKSFRAYINPFLKDKTKTEDIMAVLNCIKFNGDRDSLINLIYSIYVENWRYPQNDETLRLEIGSMYTEDSLRQCYLDGFFWAIPFDVDPYERAIAIQEKEFEDRAREQEILNKKQEMQRQIQKQNAKVKKEIKADNSISQEEIERAKKIEETKKKILQQMTEGAIPLKVEAHYKSMPNIPMEQTIYLKLDTSDLQKSMEEAIKRGMEEQRIIQNGGTVLKQG